MIIDKSKYKETTDCERGTSEREQETRVNGYVIRDKCQGLGVSKQGSKGQIRNKVPETGSGEGRRLRREGGDSVLVNFKNIFIKNFYIICCISITNI